MQNLSPDLLVPMDVFGGDFPITIDVVYAQPKHPRNLFGALYHPQARLWLHRDMALIVLRASQFLAAWCGWKLRLLDGYRPIEAQAEMQKLGLPPDLLAGPGEGGHPRGLAIDLHPEDASGALVDMGTGFDEFDTDLSRNPADRRAVNFAGGHQRVFTIRQHRAALESAMRLAAYQLELPLEPLLEEWWDFRLSDARVDALRPLADAELPSAMKHMTAPSGNLSAAQVALIAEIRTRLGQLQERAA